jgi:tetratricopeptide (TPR) repeat protein
LIVRRGRRLRLAVWVATGAWALGVATAPAWGQARGPAGREFTRQLILVNAFASSDRRAGRSVANALRGRIQRAYDRREVGTLGGADVSTLLDGSGIDPDQALIGGSLSAVARALRADEIVSGHVEVTPRGVRASARLSLVRDERLVEPLGTVEAPHADSAATLLALRLRAARMQLTAHRRCENLAREGAFVQAAEAARAGIGDGAPASIVRLCLMTALLRVGADARAVLAEARAVLAADAVNYWALDGAARALDALGERPAAAAMWLRLAATDTTNLDLARRVVEALLRGGSATAATPLMTRLVALAPDDLPTQRLRWQLAFTLRDWPVAVATGERLMAMDQAWAGDSTFVLRLATAMKAAGAGVKALGLAAQATLTFPGDPRLYGFYAQLVHGEAQVAVTRGVERFPAAADLHLLRAQELRREGRTAEAAQTLQQAVALDPTLGQGYLQLAQTQADLGLADSAFVSTQRALTAGEEKATVARFALARGNALYRAANASRERAALQSAMRFLALADSLASTAQSRFLLGASALAISQSAATDAATSSTCELSQLAGSLLPLAREKLVSGAEVSPEAARQYLAYLDQLEPVVTRQLETLCRPGG